MRRLPTEQPPSDTPIPLREWLSRVVILINAALEQVLNLDNTLAVPKKPENGMIRYFPAPVLPDITTKGFWGYDDGWTKLN